MYVRRPRSVARFITRVLSQVHPGPVILMHDGGEVRSNTIAALPVVINALKRQGYSFITLDRSSSDLGHDRSPRPWHELSETLG